MGKKHKNKHKHNNNHDHQQPSTQEPQKPQWPSSEVEKSTKPKKVTVVVGLLVVLAIILGVTLGGKEEVTESDTSDVSVETEQEAETMSKREARKAERAERKAAKAAKEAEQEAETSEENTENAAGISAQSMEPIVEGEFVYRFEGLDWTFVKVEEPGARVPVTSVNMMFENFSRRQDGTLATFGKPYKLGSYEGECQEVAAIDFDTTVETGIPLGYVQCVFQDTITDVVLFQEGKEVVTKSRVTTDGETGVFRKVTSIDLTTVVR